MAKVLVVEDEQYMLALMEQIIEELGHKVFVAVNGQEALNIIKQEHPQLVISDVMMPVMDGYSLLKEIRLNSDWKFIKVVLVSAAPINRQKPPPADAYISKPYDLGDLETLVSTFTGNHNGV